MFYRASLDKHETIEVVSRYVMVSYLDIMHQLPLQLSEHVVLERCYISTRKQDQGVEKITFVATDSTRKNKSKSTFDFARIKNSQKILNLCFLKLPRELAFQLGFTKNYQNIEKIYSDEPEV